MKLTGEMNRLAGGESRLRHALMTASLLEDVMLYFYHREYSVEWDPGEKDKAAAIKLEVDKKCDFLARTYLTSLYPLTDQMGFVGEESFIPTERKKEYYWCVDPICGSLGYRKKTGNFGTSVALIHQGRPLLGVMNCPVRGWTGAAVLQPKPAVAYSRRFRKRAKSGFHLITSANKKKHPNLREIVKRLEAGQVTYAESLPVKSLGLLMGKFDLFYGMPSRIGGGKYNIWDIAATAAFAAAEKCILTDAFGNPLRLDHPDHRFYDGIIMARDESLARKAVEITKQMTSSNGEIHPVSVKLKKKKAGYVAGLRCILCGGEFREGKGRYTCPDCGEEGILDVCYDYDAVARNLDRSALQSNPDPSHWRYLPLLPIANSRKIPPLRVGGSPLYNAKSLARLLGLKELRIKDDGMNPTASLKDRASSVGVARAMAERAGAITCASTGNAASSLAGSSAAAGISSFIFVPEKAPPAKIAQLLVFGANVFVVEGTYEQAFELSMLCAREFGFYNRNSGINPYLVEGKKTVTLEMCEQMNWNVPDWVFVSVGDGCTIAGVWKGFVELKAIDLIDRLPRLVGVQARGAAPILKAWKTGKPLSPVTPRTLADSIAVGTPRNWRKAIRAVNDSGGFYIAVTDREILSAMKMLGETCGIFGEPAGACGLAGIIRSLDEKRIPPSSQVATIVSGNGLKDVEGALRATGAARRIPPEFGKVRGIVNRILKNRKS